jgi:hypothetical protein
MKGLTALLLVSCLYRQKCLPFLPDLIRLNTLCGIQSFILLSVLVIVLGFNHFERVASLWSKQFGYAHASQTRFQHLPKNNNTFEWRPNVAVLWLLLCFACEGFRVQFPARTPTIITEVFLVQILRFRTLSIVLSLFKLSSFFLSKHNVSETGFCLRLQVKPTQLGQIDRASSYLRTFRS